MHEQVALTQSYHRIDAAEIESRMPARAPVATPAVPDLPPSVGFMLFGVYMALIGVFVATMARSPLAMFVIVISGLYVCAFFAVPRIMIKLEQDPSRRPCLATFLEQGMITGTGHMSGGSALAQIFVVPVCLLIGLAAMGAIGLWYI